MNLIIYLKNILYTNQSTKMESTLSENISVRKYLKAYRIAYLGNLQAEMYANKLKPVYDNIQDVIIVKAFNVMTEHLMAEQYIYQKHLLAAIEDFEKSDIGVKCLDETYEYYNWTQFKELAKKFKPVVVVDDINKIVTPVAENTIYMKSSRDKCIYDTHDETYATSLKSSYASIQNGDIYEAFDAMTGNIMKEKYIGRHHLIAAIRDFEISPLGKKCLTETPCQAWINFSDNAFNVRPYQPCTIS